MNSKQVFDFKEIVSNTNQRSKTAERYTLPLIAVDECLNNKKVDHMISGLLLGGFISGSDPLWSQLRIRKSGELLMSTGSGRKEVRGKFDIGNPVKHSSWCDKRVVTSALGMLTHYDVILLTENTKMDKNGLRRILREEVRPRLEVHISLTALFKRGKTSHEDYLRSAVRYIENEKQSGGYKEILI